MIEILYIATGDYSKYTEWFLSSVKYFAPGYEKHITILSNKLDDLDGTVRNGVKINVIKIFDLMYPFINLHKSYFIKQLDFDADYIFYFDADTLFMNVPDYDWESMFKDLDDGKILISKHPAYALKESEEKDSWVKGFMSDYLTERVPGWAAYIEKEKYTYVISSFFAANKKTMAVLNDLIIKMCRQDLVRDKGYHVPKFMDENYFNALTSDFEYGIINNNLAFSIKQYSQFYNRDTECEECKDIFLYQKNFANFKTNRQ